MAQQAGLTQFGRGFGQFADFEERVYRQMWLCAQQFKTEPEWIRVADNPRAVEFLQINEVAGMQPAIMPGPDGQMQVTQQPIIKNRPAEMDVDIIVAATPDTVALEQEVFESVMNLIQSGIDPLSPVFEVVLELAPLPDKTRLLERVQALKQQVQQQQAQQMQQQAEAQARAQQLVEAEQAAKIGKAQAETQKIVAETQGKQIGNEKEALDALLPNHLQREEEQGA